MILMIWVCSDSQIHPFAIQDDSSRSCMMQGSNISFIHVYNHHEPLIATIVWSTYQPLPTTVYWLWPIIRHQLCTILSCQHHIRHHSRHATAATIIHWVTTMRRHKSRSTTAMKTIIKHDFHHSWVTINHHHHQPLVYSQQPRTLTSSSCTTIIIPKNAENLRSLLGTAMYPLVWFP